MRTPIAFIFGALAASLIAAAAFRGAGQPLDSTFTYQGQLRNAGQLVNGMSMSASPCGIPTSAEPRSETPTTSRTIR